ncbi:MAG: threonine/serine exporter family protein [Myxococcaceae bacterium]
MSANQELHAFLMRLGRGLHEQGTPSHRLEEALNALCRRLDATGHFFSTPTALFASFEQRGQTNDVHLLRVGYGGIDLGKLSDFDAVATAVSHGEMTPRQASLELERIETRPPSFGPLQLVPCFALNSAAGSLIFGGGLPELLTAGVIGVVTGLLSWATSRSGKPWRAFEPVVAFFAAVISMLVGALVHPVAVHVAVLAGLIALLPGYTLTVAIAELANRHLASGSARATSAFMTFLTLAFGVALGTKVVQLTVGIPPTVELTPVPTWLQAVAVTVAASTFAMLFGVKRRDFAWVFLATVLGFVGARLGNMLLGPELGVFLGAFAAAAGSNLFARVLNRPAVVPLFPAIMLLVPGSVGFRGISSLMANDVVSGVQTAFTMVLMAVALVTGLLLANDIIPPKRAL